jgi:hypothetical protein
MADVSINRLNLDALSILQINVIVVVEKTAIMHADRFIKISDRVNVVQAIDLMPYIVYLLVFNLKMQVQKVQNLQLRQNMLTTFNCKSFYAFGRSSLQLDSNFHLNNMKITLYCAAFGGIKKMSGK